MQQAASTFVKATVGKDLKLFIDEWETSACYSIMQIFFSHTRTLLSTYLMETSLYGQEKNISAHLLFLRWRLQLDTADIHFLVPVDCVMFGKKVKVSNFQHNCVGPGVF